VHLIFSIFLFINLAFGYYAKVEPIQVYNIKSDISGKIIDINKSCENRICKGNKGRGNPNKIAIRTDEISPVLQDKKNFADLIKVS
jgi:hypothetical protein